MTPRMLKAALYYHDESICVLPIAPRNKMPALASWDRYKTSRSTRDEVLEWFGNGSRYNVGLVHGPVSENFVSIDVDHDAGVYIAIAELFPELCAGRIEQSGSGEGYHVPLRVEQLPDFGNKTWKTPLGSVNLRIRDCQTVAPPSVHPNGNPYKFLKWGDLVTTSSLDALMDWLDEMTPATTRDGTAPPAHATSAKIPQGDTLIEAVKAAWGSALDVFRHFGKANALNEERNGELRLCDNGGLLISSEDPTTWYCFEAEMGGGVIEAWGFCRYGATFDKRQHLRAVLLEMGQAGGVDVTAFYRRGDERATAPGEGDRGHWTEQYRGRWELLR